MPAPEAVVQFAASKVALLLGLHEFGDVSEAVIEYVYQNREELLASDAAALGVEVVSEEEQLAKLIAKTGAEMQAQLDGILRWTRNRQDVATQHTAAQLLQQVEGVVSQARGKRKLEADEAIAVKKQLSARIRQSYGSRNENLAIKTYERQRGCSVRLNNEQYYMLRFPRLDDLSTPVDFSQIETRIERDVSESRRMAADQVAKQQEDACDDGEGDGSDSQSPLFTICGMIDGLADTVRITDDDDEWEVVPILVEVKTRMRSFRVPPPLYDYIQMAVYLKMLAVDEGDLVQCLHADQAQIHVTRVSMGMYPLNCATPSSAVSQEPGGGLWVSVLLPRLYAVVQFIEKLRANDLQRLAFLNGNETERREMLRRECDFL